MQLHGDRGPNVSLVGLFSRSRVYAKLVERVSRSHPVYGFVFASKIIRSSCSTLIDVVVGLCEQRRDDPPDRRGSPGDRGSCFKCLRSSASTVSQKEKGDEGEGSLEVVEFSDRTMGRSSQRRAGTRTTTTTTTTTTRGEEDLMNPQPTVCLAAAGNGPLSSGGSASLPR